MGIDRHRRGKVKFTEKKHSVKGIISVVFDIVSVVLAATSLMASVNLKGNGTVYLGSSGVLALLFAVAGLIAGINGFREKDVFLFLPKTGIIVSLLLVLALAALYALGIFF